MGEDIACEMVRGIIPLLEERRRLFLLPPLQIPGNHCPSPIHEYQAVSVTSTLKRVTLRVKRAFIYTLFMYHDLTNSNKSSSSIY